MENPASGRKSHLDHRQERAQSRETRREKSHRQKWLIHQKYCRYSGQMMQLKNKLLNFFYVTEFRFHVAIKMLHPCSLLSHDLIPQ